MSFLHARHDARAAGAPKAMHYGKAFQDSAPALDQVASLSWRWRVAQHPAVRVNLWEDMAAGVYVIVRAPSVLSNGKGFKFGWLAKSGAPAGTHQRGILQVTLRADAPTREWQRESVDLCALFQREYGTCEGQRVLYVGVVTDADGTRSVAEADYADFALTAR